MNRQTLWPLVIRRAVPMGMRFAVPIGIAGMLGIMSCQSVPTPAPATVAPAAPSARLDLGHADGGGLVVPVQPGAASGRRVQAWAGDVERVMVRIRSAALVAGLPGVPEAGTLVAEVSRDANGQFTATLLNLPASDAAQASSLYAVSVKAIDRAGNVVNMGAGADGYTSVADGLQVDPHRLTFLPTVQLPLLPTYMFTSPTPKPTKTPKNDAAAASSVSAAEVEPSPSPTPTPTPTPSTDADAALEPAGEATASEN